MQRQMWELFSRMILEAHTSSTVRNWRSCLEMDSNLAYDTFSAEETRVSLMGLQTAGELYSIRG